MIKALDFYCGAGGRPRGLLNAGRGQDRRPRPTYEANNVSSQFITSDIAAVNIRELRARLNPRPEDPVLYAASPPCQPFSVLNTTKGPDSRRSLLLAFGQIIAEYPPDFLLIENVPGLGKTRGKAIRNEFLEILKQQGFQWIAARLDAKDYGVPQTRKRFILVASRHSQPTCPPPTTSIGQYATVRETISHYPALADGETSPEYPNHTARKLPEHHKRIVAAVPEDGGSRRDIADTSLLLPCHQRQPAVHKDVFGRMAWDQPGPTRTSRCTDVYCGRFIHPEQDRGISLREAAALQTFPDSYEFFSNSIQETARQIGNAVPVKLAQVLGQAIIGLAHPEKTNQERQS